LRPRFKFRPTAGDVEQHGGPSVVVRSTPCARRYSVGDHRSPNSSSTRTHLASCRSSSHRGGSANSSRRITSIETSRWNILTTSCASVRAAECTSYERVRNLHDVRYLLDAHTTTNEATSVIFLLRSVRGSRPSAPACQ